MTTDQERYEQIERYIAGEMPESERIAFEAALRQDPTLAETLILHRSLQQSLGNPRRRQLLNALKDVVEQEENKRPALTLKKFWPFRMAAAAAILALVAAVGTWQYLRHKAAAPTLVEQTVPAPPTTPDSGQTAPPQLLPVQQPESNRLALAKRAAFAPNPVLEPLVGTLVRGGNTGLTVTRPENNAIIHFTNGKINFELTGKSDDMPAVVLRIFNNREADFAAGKSVYQSEIPVNDHSFTLKTALKLPPGRYYALLSALGEEEPEMVLCFFAGKNE